MILSFDRHHPEISDDAFVAPSADVIGQVSLAAEASLWFGTVVRGDMHYVRIGRRTNIQDNCTVHVTTDLYPVILGEEVTVGHGAIVHGCVIADRCLIGMGAVVMDGVEVGEGSLIAGGAVVVPGTNIPPRSLYAGVPAKLRRETTAEEFDDIVAHAELYVQYARRYLAQLSAGVPPASQSP